MDKVISTAVTTPLPAVKERFYEIDLLRFVAAFAVVLFHYSYNGYVGGKNPLQYPEINSFTRYGYFGVELFFIISGFVISLSAEKCTPKKFVVSRIVRLYPMYWVSCTLTCLLLYLLPSNFKQPSMGQYLWNMTMFQSFVGVNDIDGVYWTLACELKFYFLIFILLIFNHYKNIEWFCIGWTSYCLLFAFGLKIRYVGFFLLPEFAPFFIAGVLFYLMKKNGFKLRYIGHLFVIFALSVFFSIKQRGHLSSYHDQYSDWIIGCVVAVFFLLFILVAGNKLKWIKGNAVIDMGIITYPLYLLHAYIGYIFFQNIDEVLGRYTLLISLVVFFLALAYLSHLYIEKPFAAKIGAWLKRI